MSESGRSVSVQLTRRSVRDPSATRSDLETLYGPNYRRCDVFKLLLSTGMHNSDETGSRSSSNDDFRESLNDFGAVGVAYAN